MKIKAWLGKLKWIWRGLWFKRYL